VRSRRFLFKGSFCFAAFAKVSELCSNYLQPLLSLSDKKIEQFQFVAGLPSGLSTRFVVGA